MNNFITKFNDFFNQRRFSKIPEPYPKDPIYKEYNEMKKIQVTLKPGQMLFIPAGWFHYVLSEEPDESTKLNVSTNFFTVYTDGCFDCKDFTNQVFSETLVKESIKTLEYDKYIKGSQPFVIKDYFKKNALWDVFGISQLNLTSFIKSEKVVITRSDNKLFTSNYTIDYFPNSCHEEVMTIDQFLKVADLNKGTYNYYMIQNEMDKDKIVLPSFVNGKHLVKNSLWINFGNVYSSLHYDMYNNIFVQVQGTRKIILLPPNKRNKLHLMNPLNTSFLCNLKKMTEYYFRN
jgi:hypothetical protein